MKRILLFWIVIIVGVTSASAQFLVGGSFGLDFTGGEIKSINQSSDYKSSFTWQLSPKVGYYLIDDLAVGVEATFIKYSLTEPSSWDDSKIVTDVNGWMFGGFARYNLIGYEKLSLLLEGGAGIGKVTSKITRGSS